MEAFAKVSVEACVFLFVEASIFSMKASTEAFMSFHAKASSAGDRTFCSRYIGTRTAAACSSLDMIVLPFFG